MIEGMTGSTVPRRQLGRHLRDLRNQSRLTVRAAARQLEWSEAKMWRIETGQTSLRSHDVETMCKVYGAPAGLTKALMGLAKETKARGWWHAYGDVIPEGFDLFIGLEEAASRVWWYESELVPGLLQTEAYARTIIRADNADEADNEIERRVHLRIARQVLLTRAGEPPTLTVALNEGVLRRPIGGNNVMAGQLAHLLEVGELPNVTIKVIPFSAGLHLGVMSGPFGILRFPVNGDGSESEPPTVYADGYTGDLYLDKPGEVARYDAAFKNIWATALTEQDSRHLISEVAGTYGHR
ncbi:helix-turn-helix domain-containing protein [Streptomyces netropsis]|uniref:Transcriptional regulator with XRE-family HTH domain n=1 Tax=Streptomyces netropsis TaxID=55404 RepID=A0A7W7PED5_STRNE|nr:helix-turn-helix transcriptional regulator [Streptomyces netropsis]MBB4886023.1 transcriptional regulator with XRE-family HTH domain [Streptomyces netropsis]GGR17175.1 transcriptional regulator [Streptomyces netropsis]